MDFPSAQLLLLLDVVRGKKDWDSSAFDAALDVIRYVYHQFIDKGEIPIGMSALKFDAENAIENILAEHDNPEAVGIGPAVWVSLGLWLAKIIIERLAK